MADRCWVVHLLPAASTSLRGYLLLVRGLQLLQHPPPPPARFRMRLASKVFRHIAKKDNAGVWGKDEFT